jgi:hypothetical protein
MSDKTPYSDKDVLTFNVDLPHKGFVIELHRADMKWYAGGKTWDISYLENRVGPFDTPEEVSQAMETMRLLKELPKWVRS